MDNEPLIGELPLKMMISHNCQITRGYGWFYPVILYGLDQLMYKLFKWISVWINYGLQPKA